ncbi:hypothetical protein CHS0354_029470 [Potamilus streckersoni]|uniref:Double zinc ribbon and ankyrin repeat-containing protein 1 n=1 Tax=Potamilus streckersoni TaxID=2493646 RepID=A0AAE0W2C0_9BIVA|nr:hypothetical protein CHS0354_029470 [Potamilus streckersoni]
MTAGSIAVPTVVPLRPPLLGRSKTSIDSNTKIELSTETRDVDIYYTLNGTKPDPFPRAGVEKCTMKYMGPFTVPAGKQTVKAMAVSKDGVRESGVVTKIFEVEYAPPPSMAPEDDDLEFQDELAKERTKSSIKRAVKNLTSSKTAWTDVSTMKDLTRSGTPGRQSQTGTRFLNSRMSDRSPTRQEILDTSHSEKRQTDRSERRHLDTNSHTARLQREAEYLKSIYGSTDPYTKYTRVPPPEPGIMGTCAFCKYIVPFNAPNCVVCEGPIPPQRQHESNLKAAKSLQAQWLPVTMSPAMVPRPTNDMGTQTVGLFYPSTREMGKQKEKEEEKEAFEKSMRDRKPLLTAVSPGKGYWRKQVDHICQHLKAHAQNDAEFRALIGEPKMGKLLTSTVQEDGYELSLTLTFALRGNKDKFTGKRLGITGDYLSFHTEQDSLTSYRSDSEEEIIETETPKKETKRVTKVKRKPVPKVPPQDQLLLRELGSQGEGSPSEVQRLLDEGSDPNCINKNGLPALHVAVKNKRVDCIPVLVQGGADINRKGPAAMRGNTALHEAIGLGPSGDEVIDALLGSGADQNKKNDKGETAYDLAVKAGFENLVRKLASALGQSHLDKMIRPRTKGPE